MEPLKGDRPGRWASAETLEHEQNRVLGLVASGAPLRETLAALVDAVERLVPDARACVLTSDEDGACVGDAFTADFPPSFGLGIRGVALDDAPFGRSAGSQAHEGIVCGDLETSDRWPAAWKELCRKHGIVACCALPVFADHSGNGARPVASLLLCFPEDRGMTAWERRVAASAASLAAIAIERERKASALSQSARNARLLQELSVEFIVEHSPQAVLEKIVDSATALMDSPFASLQLLESRDGKRMELRLLAYRGFHPEATKSWARVPVDETTTGSAALRSGKRSVLSDIETGEAIRDADDLSTYRRAGVRAMQSTPLLSRSGEPLGVISTHWSRPHSPSERELSHFDVLARQAADVLERRLSEQALRENEALLLGQKEAFQAALDDAPLESSLGILVRIAAGRFESGTARAAFYLADPEGKSLRHVVGMGEAYGEAVDGFQIGAGSLACGFAAHTGAPIVTPDVREDPAWTPWLWLAERFDYRSCWSFPIHSAEGPFVGTIAFYFREPRWPRPRDLELGEILSQTAAIIIARYSEAEERRRAEGEVLRQTELIRRVNDSTAELIFMKDRDGRLIYANAATIRVLGREPISGARGLDAFRDAADDEGIAANDRRVLEKGETIVAEEPFTGADGDRRLFVSTKSPLRDRDGSIVGVIGVSRDVTAMKEAEQALREADRRKDEFLATLSHELRNPMAPIVNSVALLGRIGNEDPAARQAVATIDRQVAHLSRLIDDLLDVSRISQGKIALKRERVDLATLLRDALATCESTLRHQNQELTVNLPPESIPVDADPVRFSQIFANLLQNASKYNHPLGKIWVAAARDDGGLAISVRDTGIGIPADKLSSVFDLFSQAGQSLEKEHGGLGIGLYLVKRLVELHGGSIEAHSAGPGQGSEFVVRFPASILAKEIPRESVPRVDAAVPDPASSRILVVEDNRDAATSLAALLRLDGYETEVAVDGHQALEQALRFLPSIVLLDIGLPRMNGYDVCRSLRAMMSLRQPFIVALTGWGQFDDRRRSQEAGFDHHFVKPVRYESLRRLLAGLGTARRVAGYLGEAVSPDEPAPFVRVSPPTS